ncbi:MAG: hypothetical protein V3W31_02330, partial [Thermodesulfobacteriota bacterium]
AALISFSAAGTGGFIFSNGYLDASPEVAHTATVLRKTEVTGDKSTSYYVFVPAWGDREGELKISVNSHFYNSVREGDAIVVATKAGYRGVEWIVSYAKTETEEPARVSGGEL